MNKNIKNIVKKWIEFFLAGLDEESKKPILKTSSEDWKKTAMAAEGVDWDEMVKERALCAAKPRVDVELVAGPLDGHRAAVLLGPDMFIFREVGEGCSASYAYQWVGLTCGEGTRWVLKYHCQVARWRSEEVISEQ